MTQLTKQDRLQIVNSHIRNLEFRKYGVELDIMAEESKAIISADLVEKLQSSLDEVNNQIAALESEYSRVNALAEEV